VGGAKAVTLKALWFDVEAKMANVGLSFPLGLHHLRQMRALVCVGMGLLALPVLHAQTLPEPRNVVQLSASAQEEVVQDWLTVVLVARHQASDAATVQNQLKLALDRGVSHARARSAAQGGLEVSTGAFSVQPRYNREGQIVGWQGTAELRLQGRDVARVSTTAGDTPGMTVSQMYFSLSREARQNIEADIRGQAIASFKQSAQQVAQDFGFGAYTLREVSISEGANDAMARPRVMMAAEVGAAMSAAPVPAEPGKSLVQVTVSGSVQLR
jgi:predicted secreted protein